MWAKLREALRVGLAIDNSQVLEDDLTGVEYDHDDKDRLRLEKKAHMKARGLASPDDGDALALTYAYHVAPRGSNEETGSGGSDKYDPLA